MYLCLILTWRRGKKTDLSEPMDAFTHKNFSQTFPTELPSDQVETNSVTEYKVVVVSQSQQAEALPVIIKTSVKLVMKKL